MGIEKRRRGRCFVGDDSATTTRNGHTPLDLSLSLSLCFPARRLQYRAPKERDATLSNDLFSIPQLQLQDQRALNQAFSKRKAGLFASAADLSRLSADACVFVFVGSAARGNSWAYATRGKFSRRTIGRSRRRRRKDDDEEENGGRAATAAAAAAPERPRPTKKSKTFYSGDTRTATSAVLQLLRAAASAADGGREYAPETAVIGEEEDESESEIESEIESEEEEEEEVAAAAAAATAAEASSGSSSSDSESDSSDDDSSDNGSSDDDNGDDDDDESSSDGDSSEGSSSSDDDDDRGDTAPPPPPPLLRPSAKEDVFSLEEGEKLVPLPVEAALAPAPAPPASVARLSDTRRVTRGRR